MSEHDHLGQHVPPERRDADHDRELDELLSELRVVLPGTTVLFAFLLTLPFSGGITNLSTTDQILYFVAFLSTAISIIFLIGPSAYHRLIGSPYDKGLMLQSATRQAIAGTVFLGFALVAAVLLVSDVMYGGLVPLVAAASIGACMIALWIAFPLYRRYRSTE